MITEENVAHVKNLYENIFKESAENSKEFITFASGNPHPLRVKLDDWLSERQDLEVLYNFNTNTEIHAYMNEVACAYELDCLIMNYIENNG